MKTRIQINIKIEIWNPFFLTINSNLSQLKRGPKFERSEMALQPKNQSNRRVIREKLNHRL